MLLVEQASKHILIPNLNSFNKNGDREGVNPITILLDIINNIHKGRVGHPHTLKSKRVVPRISDAGVEDKWMG